MSSGFGPAPDISSTLQSVTQELRRLEQLLLSAEKPDPRILTEFRDAVNRIRQAAWTLYQYGEVIADQTSLNPVASILARERIRTVCQLCKLIEADLQNPEINFLEGQLEGLCDTLSRLAYRLTGHTES